MFNVLIESLSYKVRGRTNLSTTRAQTRARKMRITDFNKKNCTHRRQYLLKLAVVCGTQRGRRSSLWRSVAMVKAMEESLNLERLAIRSQLISATSFNLNSYSDCQSLKDFRFTKSDICRIASTIHWTGKSQRNGYVCNQITACCIML